MHFLITVQPRCALSLRDSCPRQVHGPGSILGARSEMRQSFFRMRHDTCRGVIYVLRVWSRGATLCGAPIQHGAVTISSPARPGLAIPCTS